MVTSGITMTQHSRSDLQNTAAGWCYQVYHWFKGDQLMAEGPPSPSAQAAVIDGMVWVENQTANPE